MSGEKRDRILIALDGSEHAFEGVIYISRIPCFQRMLLKSRYISIPFDEKKLKERNRALSILQKMSNFLASSSDIGVLLKGALSIILQRFNLEAGRIYLMEPDNEHLYLGDPLEEKNRNEPIP